MHYRLEYGGMGEPADSYGYTASSRINEGNNCSRAVLESGIVHGGRSFYKIRFF